MKTIHSMIFNVYNDIIPGVYKYVSVFHKDKTHIFADSDSTPLDLFKMICDIHNRSEEFDKHVCYNCMRTILNECSGVKHFTGINTEPAKIKHMTLTQFYHFLTLNKDEPCYNIMKIFMDKHIVF